MVRYILLGLLSFGLSLSSNARIVPIILVNTFDETIGNSCSIDRTTALYFFSELREILDDEIRPIVLEGSHLSKKELEKLYSFDFHDDDFIFIFISSHGGRNTDDKTSFPRIIFPDKEYLSSYDIFERFRKCKHRSLLMVSDVCNSAMDQVPEEDEDHLTSRRPLTSVRGSIVGNQITRENVRKFFVESCFDLLINSSPAYMKALITEHGSLFTSNFFYSLASVLKSEGYVDVYDVIKKTQKLTKMDTETYFKKRGDRKKVNNSNGPYIPIDSLIQDCSNNIRPKYFDKNFGINTIVKKAAAKYRLYGNKYRLDLRINCLDQMACSEIDSVTYYLAKSLNSQIETRYSSTSICTFNVHESTYITAIITFKNGDNVFLRTLVTLPK
jgi:hypothetical protein